MDIQEGNVDKFPGPRNTRNSQNSQLETVNEMPTTDAPTPVGEINRFSAHHSYNTKLMSLGQSVQTAPGFKY